ncbi:MAG: response regulator transcription factor [Alphaproteobacteria bacterium]
MRVLVIEDEVELGKLVESGLAKAGFAVDRFETKGDGEEALAVADYDALVLDLGLPDGDGLTLLKALRAEGSSLPILVLTARDAPEDRVLGLNGGADDYLMKPFYFDELVARIKALLRRPGQALGARLTLGNLALDTASGQLSVGDAPVPLARRETALVETLLRRQGQVVSKSSLEDSLYAFDQEVTPNAIEVSVHRLRKTLEKAGAEAVIATIRGVGYLMTKAGDHG